jgi:hypothetical protein
LLTNDYDIVIGTVGYSQQILHVHVVLGGNTDASVWMVKEPVIDLTLVFKTEGFLSAISSTQPFAQPLNSLDSTPARVEVYDASGNFVAANNTYIPNFADDAPTTTDQITIAGFSHYFGDPKLTWSGFYDTTDAARQLEDGLTPGTYEILVWVDGYYQPDRIQVTLQARGNVSLVESMERTSRVNGLILGPDFYDGARLLSWAVIDVEPGNLTTFSLDGSYQIWVPSGSHRIGVSFAGFTTKTMDLEVPAASDLNVNFWLGDPQPVEEFSSLTLPTIIFSTALTLVVLRRFSKSDTNNLVQPASTRRVANKTARGRINGLSEQDE